MTIVNVKEDKCVVLNNGTIAADNRLIRVCPD